MGKYNYPDDWRRLAPLAQGDWHRHMGAFGRRVRFLLAICAIDPAWRRRWWDGQNWRDHHPDRTKGY